MQIRPFEPADEAAVIALWDRCGLLRPWNDPHKDIQRKRAVHPERFLVGILEDQLVATVMFGYDGHRGWIYYLGVSPDHQRQGLARMIAGEAERQLREAGCPKINLQVRSSNTTVIDFYRSLGFTEDPVLSFGKRLEQDERVVTAEFSGATGGSFGPPVSSTSVKDTGGEDATRGTRPNTTGNSTLDDAPPE